MKFECLFDNGQRVTMHARDWNELMQPGNLDPEGLASITAVDKEQLRFDIKAINSALHDAGRLYWDSNAIYNYLVDSLKVHGFALPENHIITFGGESGEARCVPIGKGVYLCVTWHRMRSGKYEFVGYIS